MCRQAAGPSTELQSSSDHCRHLPRARVGYRGLVLRQVGKKVRNNQHKWKPRAVTGYFLFCLVSCTRPMSTLAGPTRTLRLPITWYLREVEKTWRAHQAPLHLSKLSPLWGQPAHCGEGVSRVRNRKTEVKISSGQRRASGWPAEGQMGGEKVDDVPGKLILFIPILGILPQPCSNVLLPAAGALGKLLQLETATTKMFPPGHPNHTTVVLLLTPWVKERLLSCCSGLTDPQGQQKATSLLDNPMSISSWLHDILLWTELIFLHSLFVTLYQQLPSLQWLIPSLLEK